MKTDQFLAAIDCYTRAIQLDGRNAVYFCNRFVRPFIFVLLATEALKLVNLF
jgi:hypothetical protein